MDSAALLRQMARALIDGADALDRARWDGAAVPARQADELVAFWGVCTHFKYPAYRDRKDALAQAVVDAGMRWVRDGWGAGKGHEDTASATLVRHGLGLHATHSPVDTGGVETQAAIQAIADAHARRLGPNLIGVEGWNEPGGWGSYAGDPKLRGRVQAWQAALWRVYRSTDPYRNIPIAGPSLADSNAPAKWAALDLSAHADRANVHDYPGPSYVLTGDQLDLFTANAARMVGPRRITTETGQSTGQGKAAYPVPDEDAAGITIPRVQWEHFRRGWELSATYELVDQGTDGAFENSFGLLRNDLSPKPAYTTISNTLNLLADPGPAFATAPLPVTIDGGPATRHVLLQKRDGSYWLALWEQAQVWTKVGRAPSVAVPVALTFDRARTMATYDPHTGREPASSQTGRAAVVTSTEKTTLIRIAATPG